MKPIKIKKLLYTLFVALLILGCEEEIQDTFSTNDIILTTDRVTYNYSDTIFLSLENRSMLTVVVGKRCSQWLEMNYQQNIDGKWSDDKIFQYMYLRCPTFQDSITTQNKGTFYLACDFFDSKGEFRLEVPCYVPELDSSITVTSNTFNVE